MTQRQWLRRTFKLAGIEPGIATPYCEACAAVFEADTTLAELWTHLKHRHQAPGPEPYGHPPEHSYRVLEIAYEEETAI